MTFHLGNSGYQERYSGDWGEYPDPDGLHGDTPGRSAFQWTMFYRDRPIMETICNLIYNNLFGRFPNVRVASIENGAVWVPYLLTVMDNMKGMGRNGPWPNGYVHGKPERDLPREGLRVTPPLHRGHRRASSSWSERARCCSARTSRTPKGCQASRTTTRVPKS